MENSSGNLGSSRNIGHQVGYKDLTQMVHFNLPLDILDEVDEYVKETNKHSRVEAVRDLLRAGLWIAKKKDELEKIFRNPHLMDEITGQLKEGGLVDFVQHMDASQFLVVWSIFKTEARARMVKF